MAQIKVNGSAMVVTAQVTLEALKNIQKHRPNALKLMSDDGKECIFAIGVAAGRGSINKFGATFSDVTHNTEGLATITLDIPAEVTDVQEYAMEKIGVAIIHINNIEQRLGDTVAEIDAERALVMQSITID